MLCSNTGHIQPSQQGAARAWAKFHRTAGPAVWPAEAQGLRDPLTGAPGLWQGAALLLPREDSLHSASRPCSCGPRQLAHKRRALMRPKNEKTHPSVSSAARGAAGGEEGRRLQSVVAFHPRKEPPEREKLRQPVPR